MTSVDVLIVGAGPAGLAAAVAAASTGARVTVVDERPSPGGRLLFEAPGATSLDAYLNACERLGVEIRPRTVAWGVFPGWTVSFETPDGADVVTTGQLILATGSTDLGLSFDGNTLPGVMSGTGLRRLIGEFGVLPGRRVLILGDGPDGNATAEAVRAAGGTVVASIPEADARAVVVQGSGGVENATVDGKRLEVDIVAVAIGRQPDLQLAAMSGHQLAWVPLKGGWSPRGAETMPGLQVAGDAAGVDTIEVCELDGALAGARAAAQLGRGADDVDRLAARLAELRPDRSVFTGDERLHQQPWLVPIEGTE